MSNFLANGVFTKLKEQSKLLKDSADFSVSDEVQELDRKYGDCIVGYNNESFYISKIIDSSTGPIFVGSLFRDNTWTPLRVDLADPGLDLRYNSGGLRNTPSGLYEIGRTTRKQYKWGLTPNNCFVQKMEWIKGIPRVSGQLEVRNNLILPYLFKEQYPHFTEIRRSRKSYKLKNGIALSPIVTLFFNDGIYRLYYKSVLVSQSEKMKDGFKLSEKYLFLKELLSDCCEVV